VSGGAEQRPLSGYRVLDFSHAAAGPFATVWLADLGAEIIKIEKPVRGDGARYMGEPLRGKKDSDYFVAINTDKSSVTLDLSMPDAIEIAHKLAAESDIVVQNFRPGVMDRLSLGFKDLAPLRKGLVYCSISAFGSKGPMAGRPANDIIMQGVTGMMSITGEPEGDPVRVGVPISDFSTGLFSLSGVLAALLVRDRYPEGQHIEVSMFDATISLMANFIPGVLDLGKEVPRLGRGHPQIVPYQAFRCGDDSYMIVGAFTSAFWRRLCAALEHEEWITDERFETNDARVANRGVLIPMIEALFESRPREYWDGLLERFDVPHTPVNTVSEALRSGQAAANELTHELEGDDGETMHVVANPIRTEAWPQAAHRVAPRLGADTERVLSELLSLSQNEITDLADRGVVSLEESYV
jgi:crotonobetainyl-CoA:carnitine CoA-transferase CaiB-like acyl-CoA transferase